MEEKTVKWQLSYSLNTENRSFLDFFFCLLNVKSTQKAPINLFFRNSLEEKWAEEMKRQFTGEIQMASTCTRRTSPLTN